MGPKGPIFWGGVVDAAMNFCVPQERCRDRQRRSSRLSGSWRVKGKVVKPVCGVTMMVLSGFHTGLVHQKAGKEWGSSIMRPRPNFR